MMRKNTKKEIQRSDYRLAMFGVLLMLMPLILGATVAAFVDASAFRMLEGILGQVISLGAAFLTGYGLRRRR